MTIGYNPRGRTLGGAARGGAGRADGDTELGQLAEGQRKLAIGSKEIFAAPCLFCWKIANEVYKGA